MATETFVFFGEAGNAISGRLESPPGAVRAWAIFAHCLTCGRDSLAAVRISRALALHGIGTLRFDFTGVGGDDIPFPDDGYASGVADIRAAAAALAKAGKAPSLLVGHSFGGMAALAAAVDMESLRAVVTIAAPFHPDTVGRAFGRTTEAQAEALGQVTVQGSLRSFILTRAFFRSLRTIDTAATLARLNVPLLVLHPGEDAIVPVSEAQAIMAAARPGTGFMPLPGADHLLLEHRHTGYAARLIASWSDAYLDERPLADARAPTAVVAEETGEGLFQLRVSTPAADFLADEPVAVGGLGSGPSPFELLASALAACTTMTLRSYAQRKGWPVTKIATSVGHRLEPGHKPSHIFSRRISMAGTLDADQTSRLLEIADRCPVHRTLVEGASVETLPGAPPAKGEALAGHAEQIASLE